MVELMTKRFGGVAAMAAITITLAGRSSTPKQQIIVQQAPAATVVHKHVTINKTVTVRKTIVRSRSARGRR